MSNVIPNRDAVTGDVLNYSKPFSSSDGFRFRGNGISGTIPLGTTNNLDYKLTEERWLNGAELIVKDQAWGDSVKFQIVDVDNILGYGAGTVLDEFGTDWRIVSDKQMQSPVILPYPAKILANLYIRLKYTSVGATDVSLACNLHLHKKT